MIEIKIKADNKFVIVDEGKYNRDYIWCWSQFKFNDTPVRLFNPNNNVVVFNSHKDAEKEFEKINDKEQHKEDAVIMSVEDYIKIYWNKFNRLPKNININDYITKLD